ncbi:NAD(P)/FAD-dependent oxidoreductase [Arcobacter lacus]|uniref:Sulfide:quinone reductase n=1 Tax=Arcobacter lacus TaxID=1912876 RepID=A0ABX5JLN7_9BACT|nr:FAD/NAD(P)-binding oxidoreductase [Arcobacter lacus]MCT7909559.1 NAD(P)/FAD-dependent oxidoreductase [Arcobacter lacus]MCT7911562.1 NAD(P)/FAD-dependent oxidoreductase [Arcobacter lacus]PUE67044.1 sulfide:quinone reductase [Arcobacter lacus]
MKKNELDKALEIFDAEIKKTGLSRREAFKVAGLGGAAFLLGGNEAEAATVAKASDAKAKIVIVGGGLAGISTAARLVNSLSEPDITIIEPNPKSVSYQPGTTLVASGVYASKDELMYETKDYLPKGVTLIKDKAVDFNPEANKVTLESGEVLSYDFLIVAAGIVLNYGAIKGLEEVGEAYSVGDASKILKVFGDSGVTSVYNIDSAVEMWNQMQKFVQKAKDGQKVKGVFTDPNTAIKCGGAPKKVMYLTNARLNEAKARANAELNFYADSGKLFGVKEYADAIEKQFIARDMKWNFNHNLIAVDVKNKVATFDKYWQEKGAFDKDLEEYEMVTKHQNVDVPFDFLHITPPQKAPTEIGNSAIGSDKGWIPVNKETLQHVKYNNIFALGDIAAVPMGKTGGSVRKQYKVLVDNLISVMEGKEPTAKYAGYTVCPLITDIGKVMLAEFDWTAKPTPSFPLDPTQERYIWWLLKVYLLKPMTIHGMLSGKA